MKAFLTTMAAVVSFVVFFAFSNWALLPAIIFTYLSYGYNQERHRGIHEEVINVKI